jgi:methylmalonyl-CoA mutase C-terminal domain/subunit
VNTEQKKVRILFAKPGLDGHDVGAKVVVRSLLEAGFDVIYTGLRKTPEEIVSRAYAERVDVLGLSILSGSHLPICRRIQSLLLERGRAGMLWLVGGNIPDQDHEELKKLGVDGVFSVGTPLQSIVDFIRDRQLGIGDCRLGITKTPAETPNRQSPISNPQSVVSEPRDKEAS